MSSCSWGSYLSPMGVIFSRPCLANTLFSFASKSDNPRKIFSRVSFWSAGSVSSEIHSVVFSKMSATSTKSLQKLWIPTEKPDTLTVCEEITVLDSRVWGRLKEVAGILGTPGNAKIVTGIEDHHRWLPLQANWWANISLQRHMTSKPLRRWGRSLEPKN